MAHIFVSYKRADAARAARIVALLEAEGWSVWWDTRLSGGEHWDAVIERELEAARCVVVVWSPSSIDRDKAYWVHLEAHHGRERGILVPVTIEGSMPPFAFKLIQARDLTHWNGAAREGAEKFLDDVRKTLGRAPDAAPAVPQTAPVRHAEPAGSTLALAAAEWARLEKTADVAALELFAKHFAGTYYAALAEKHAGELEAAVYAEAEARAKAAAEQAERQRAEVKRAEIRAKITRAGGRDEVLALWQAAPQAAAARVQGLGYLKIPSSKDNKAVSYWLKPGESFRDLDAGPEMVIIPAGEFWMGSRDNEGGAYERPLHKVTIPRAFAVGKYPVTFAEWDAAFAVGGVKQNPADNGWGRGRMPVINVSWDDAQAYIKWLSDKTGQPYRLLSEAEWEYACRAGTATAYSFGDGESDLNRYAWNLSNSGGKTHLVGEKPANCFGLYDMHGNIREWCEDTWHGNYSGKPNDLKATGGPWIVGGDRARVARGASWNYSPSFHRAAGRLNGYPEYRSNDYGLRLARTLNPSS
jgi:formylglycine-generating enzyme required for sulfatase activity